MREIKFRAWFHGINLMGQVTNLKGSNDGFVFDGVVAECWPDGRQQFYEAYKNFELMQYTGLKDKNGKEIYEHDVVECDGRRRTIRWANGKFWFVAESSNQHEDISEMFGRYYQKVIVIGNIYES